MNFIIRTEKNIKNNCFHAYMKTQNENICIGDGKTEIEAIKNVISVYEDILKINNSSTKNT